MTTSILRKRSVATLVAGAALTATVAAPVAASPAAGPAAKRTNIVNTAVKAGQFKTLVALVKRAGLAKTLSAGGPYTVFAPTDAAFKKVPKSTLNALLKDRAKLRAVLLYHVAKGRLTSKKVVKLKAVKTLNGQSLSVRARSGGVFVGGARVTTPDVRASNGVIHVINRVLVPQS
ncbi:MAG TPA: fasciclin domain-containing protein [Thermoleophilaceae bacterium]